MDLPRYFQSFHPCSGPAAVQPKPLTRCQEDRTLVSVLYVAMPMDREHAALSDNAHEEI